MRTTLETLKVSTRKDGTVALEFHVSVSLAVEEAHALVTSIDAALNEWATGDLPEPSEGTEEDRAAEVDTGDLFVALFDEPLRED